MKAPDASDSIGGMKTTTLILVGLMGLPSVASAEIHFATPYGLHVKKVEIDIRKFRAANPPPRSKLEGDWIARIVMGLYLCKPDDRAILDEFWHTGRLPTSLR